MIASRLLRKFEVVNIRHIPRLQNQEANDLAQISPGYKILKEKLQDVVEVRGIVVSTRLFPSNLEETKLGYANKENFEILAMDCLAEEDWRKPIVEYLENPTASTERKLRYRALSHVLMGNKLFKKTPQGVLLKCLNESEAYITLSSIHNGAYGGTSSRSQYEMAIISTRNVLTYHVERLYGIR